MDKDKVYFKVGPVKYVLIFIGVFCGMIIVTNFSLQAIGFSILSFIMISLVFGFSPAITFFKDRMNLKYYGVHYFRSKTIYYNKIKHARVEHVVVKYPKYVTTITIGPNEKSIDIILKEDEHVRVLLHLLSNEGIKVYKNKNDVVTDRLFRQVKHQQQTKQFNKE